MRTCRREVSNTTFVQREWERAGVFFGLLTKHRAYDKIIGLISRRRPRRSRHKAPGGGEGRAEPADRGNWLEWSILTDERHSIGWATTVPTARQRPFHPTLTRRRNELSSTSRRSTRPWLRQRRIRHVYAFGLNDVICAANDGTTNGAKATTVHALSGHDAVERTNSWLSNFATATEHRPSPRIARADGTRSHAAADRQTHRLAKPWRLKTPIRSPHSSVRHIDRESLVTGRTFHLRKGRPTCDPPVQVLQEGESSVEASTTCAPTSSPWRLPSEAITRARNTTSVGGIGGFDLRSAAVRRGCRQPHGSTRWKCIAVEIATWK